MIRRLSRRLGLWLVNRSTLEAHVALLESNNRRLSESCLRLTEKVGRLERERDVLRARLRAVPIQHRVGGRS